jgi:hypothetical protein
VVWSDWRLLPNPTSSVVSFGGTIGRFDIGAITSTPGATLFAGAHPENKSVTFAATVSPTQTARCTTNRIALTGNITTLNVPSGAQIGDQVQFIFAQDATGGRTVSFVASYKVSWTPVTTSNKINVITFEYDGTSWIQISSTTGI